MVVRVVGAAILAGDRCLVAQRSARMSSPLKWEFPGGKVEHGEDPRAALARELEEELGVAVHVGELLGCGEARVGERLIRLDVYLATLAHGEPVAHEHARIAWLEPAALADLDWAEPDVPIVAALLARLAR